MSKINKKKIFSEIGYFDENLTGTEDTDFNLRLIDEQEYRSYYMKEPIFHHEKNLSFIKLLNKKIYYLRNSIKFVENNLNSHQFSLGFRFFLIYFYKKNLFITLRKPHVFLLTFFYKNLQLLILGIYYLFISLSKKKKQ